MRAHALDMVTNAAFERLATLEGRRASEAPARRAHKYLSPAYAFDRTHKGKNIRVKSPVLCTKAQDNAASIRFENPLPPSYVVM